MKSSWPLLSLALFVLLTLEACQAGFPWFGSVSTPDTRRRYVAPPPPPHVVFKGAISLDRYSLLSSIESNDKFVEAYPDAIRGFVAFGGHTCGNWEHRSKENFWLLSENRPPTSPVVADATRNGAQACVDELSKEENRLYYGVTYIQQLVPVNNGASVTFSGEGKILGCYPIKKRCKGLEPVEITGAKGTDDYKIVRTVQFIKQDGSLSPISSSPKQATEDEFSQITVTTYLRQRPFTGVDKTLPYVRPFGKTSSPDEAEEYIADNDFSRVVLPDFTKRETWNAYNRSEVKVLGVHEVGDPRATVPSTSAVNVEYSLLRKGYRCRTSSSSSLDTLVSVDMGFAGTPLDCAKACVKNENWFIYNAMSHSCQCYRAKPAAAAAAAKPSCTPEPSASTDLFQYGTVTEGTATFELVQKDARCAGNALHDEHLLCSKLACHTVHKRAVQDHKHQLPCGVHFPFSGSLKPNAARTPLVPKWGLLVRMVAW